jgi:hypothetical protein
MQKLDPETIILFVFATVAFLVLCGGVLRWSRTAATKLISLGILLAVLSVVYGALIPPTAILLPGGLMKIALILVLGGVAGNVCSCVCSAPATDTAKPKEPADAR